MRSCIYGLAVGDALGVPYEFCERSSIMLIERELGEHR